MKVLEWMSLRVDELMGDEWMRGIFGVQQQCCCEQLMPFEISRIFHSKVFNALAVAPQP